MSADEMTLFGPASEQARPRTPPPEKVVRELVARGVAEDTARGYDHRQAFAVLGRLKKAQEERREPDPPPPPRVPPARAEVRGAPTPVRAAEARDLRAMLAGRCEDEALIRRVVGGCLYHLSPDELRRVAAGLADVLDPG